MTKSYLFTYRYCKTVFYMRSFVKTYFWEDIKLSILGLERIAFLLLIKTK